MPFDIAHAVELRHNTQNAVTVSVQRVTDAAGATKVRKELRRPQGGGPSLGPWAASDDPAHWNYWRREADAYTAPDLRDGLVAAGLDMPAADVEWSDTGAVLWLEDVPGTAGTEFLLDDHRAVAAGLGRWQAEGPIEAPWASKGFLRQYSGSKPARWRLLDDDAAWAQPLVRDNWPDGLRAGWQRLAGRREGLLATMERLPRTRCHLDAWACNMIRRPAGPVALLDWAFTGEGAVGEDLGTLVPDAVFDMFWPADRIDELDAECFAAYTAGLRGAGWRGSDRDARLGVVGSCVKYAWLLPRMLERAADAAQQAYHRPVDPGDLYARRGIALRHLVAWSDEAWALAGL